VFELLRVGERAVGEVAAQLPVSRPAVSQHLRVLQSAGLVHHRRRGRRHLYAVDEEGLRALRIYLETFWDDALSSFRDTVDEHGGAHR
jgi:DNA-binding transcriptional ArsR family regulator